jgi:hypothetical protein
MQLLSLLLSHGFRLGILKVWNKAPLLILSKFRVGTPFLTTGFRIG